MHDSSAREGSWALCTQFSPIACAMSAGPSTTNAPPIARPATSISAPRTRRPTRIPDADADSSLALDLSEAAEGTAALTTAACAATAIDAIARGADKQELARIETDVLDRRANPDALPYHLVLHARRARAPRAGERGGRDRRPARGRLHATRAQELAVGCGATALAQRAREEALDSGARPRRVALRGVDSLTPSELRVARRAADGNTNREIAEDLFVTVKTVEMHLANAYGKLDIRSRTQLPEVLGVADEPSGAVSAAL